MFSGIVKGVGRILERHDLGGDRRWVVAFADSGLGPLAIGGSIAVSGVCLTAIESSAERFTVDLSRETSTSRPSASWRRRASEPRGAA